ncbi:NfeD family protein [Phycisphaerales bacterium AB-hyl4]|uniref:NfeD family protein n=1 Tax=Natronomicrosphaera hydrolytica TaxID=3242702 RepID=A0ABV4UA99_9BACT
MLTITLLTLAQAGQQQPQPADETNFVVWGIVLITIAIGLFFIEIFVPSGGLIGIASAVALVGGIICLFLDSAVLGLIGATFAMLALPFAIGFAIKIWPNTPIGRALSLKSDDDAEQTDDDGTSLPPHPAARDVNGLVVGAKGRAVTDLRPVGTCVFDGKREECLAAAGTIASGSQVHIVAIDGMHVKVRRTDN